MTTEIATVRAVAGPGRDFSAFRVRAFAPADYVAVYELYAQQPGAFTVPDPLAAGQAYQALGPCYTAEYECSPLNGAPWNVLACAGLSIMSPGRAVGWALLSPALTGDRPARWWLKQQIRQRIPILMGEHGIRRLEADVTAGGINLVRSLGFGLESAMPMWGPNGETFFKFVRLRP